MKKINIILIFSLLGGTLTTFSIHGNDLPSNLRNDISSKQFTAETPIYIDGNANFTATAIQRGWNGDGTEGNPIILENMEIQGDGTNDLITIKNTNLNFTIRNSFLNNSMTGILVEFGSFGVIEGNTVTFSNDAILLSSSNNMYISNNEIHDTYTSGIFLNRADDTTVTNNTLFNSWRSIYLVRADNNNITQNRVSNSDNGILIVLSSRNLIAENVVFDSNDAILITNPFKTKVIKNMVYGNTRGIFATDSRDNLFSENVAYNNINGIHIDRQDLVGTERSNVTYNLAFDNAESGIKISFGEGMYVHDNEMYGNANGLELSFGLNHFIFNNSIHDNSIGMYLDSIDNYQIVDHNLINNGFFISYYLNNLFYHKLRSLEGNTVNGLPVKYINNTVGETITGIWGQILLVNSSFTNIDNVGVVNGSIGIFLSDSSNNTINQANLAGNYVGIGLYSNSENNTILDSEIYNGSKGIEIDSSQNNLINNTEIALNQIGVLADTADFSTIKNTDIHHNSEDGIRVTFSSNSEIMANKIHHNGFNISEFNIFPLNILSHEQEFDFKNNGIVINGGTDHTVSFNAIYSNVGFGVIVTGSGAVIDNDILSNSRDKEMYVPGPNVTRSCNTGCSQVFSFDSTSINENYYGPLGENYFDIDGDGIFDAPYQYQCGFEVDGSEITCESAAYSEPISGVHVLTDPEITSINFAIGIGEIEVFWTSSIDTQKHDISYVLTFTLTDGKGKETNTKIFSDPLSGTSLKVNSLSFAPGTYNVQIEATDGELSAFSKSQSIEVSNFNTETTSSTIFITTTTNNPNTGTGEPTTSDTSTTSSTASNLNTTRGRFVNFAIYFSLLAIMIIPYFRKKIKN